ncbi:MAG: hypothetical protein JO071_11065 [Deltaproteobacteria bacterium]|nr:hypothetical protein [Deltaproteobacteria bacterium]
MASSLPLLRERVRLPETVTRGLDHASRILSDLRIQSAKPEFGWSIVLRKTSCEEDGLPDQSGNDGYVLDIARHFSRR